MRAIQIIVDEISDEIESARTYAEKALELKSEGDAKYAETFKQMAQDELRHASYLHDYAVGVIDRLRNFYKPTADMQAVWDRSHTQYTEKVAWIKMMLDM